MTDTLEDLPGVGSTTAGRLRDIGVTSIETLAFTPIEEIKDRTEIDKSTALKIVAAAIDRMDWAFTTAKELQKKQKEIQTLTTGCQALDDLLLGGIRTMETTEFFGEYGTGKSSICFKLCVTAQQPPEQRGLGGLVLFFDTEDTFSPDRVQQIAEALELDPDPVLGGIIVSKAYTSFHQELLLDRGFEMCEEEDVKLIIVDSLMTHYRSEYIGRESLAERQQRLNRYLHRLKRLASRYNLAVVFTNQAQADPRPWYMGGGRPKGSGGHIVGHAGTHRIYLKKAKDPKRIARMHDSPYIPATECAFKLSEQGIEDA